MKKLKLLMNLPNIYLYFRATEFCNPIKQKSNECCNNGLKEF